VNTVEILRMRLRAQLIEGGGAASPRGAVCRLLAMQAQDYAGAVWAIGLRTPGTAQADVERAIADRQIVRTWPMRGTLHFVAPDDVHWLLPLLAPRALARAARREQQLELDEATFARARELFALALTGGRRLTRRDAMEMLDAAGIVTSGQRGYHILWRLAQEALIVVGPMDGRQQTFALLDEWVPADRSALDPSAPREELLAHLAARYFTGHGPATFADLARWAGIPIREARSAACAVEHMFESSEHEGERYLFAPGAADAALTERPGSVHLLPGFDEYMLGYTGRSLQLGEHLEQFGARVASNGMLASTVVVDGRAVGVWKRTLAARGVTFALTEFRPFSSAERAAVIVQQERYAAFMDRAR
jgi:hypothetical protein